MRFSGAGTVDLPKMRDFSFALTDIRLSDLETVYFTFGDTGNSSFHFKFLDGIVITDRTVSTYNTKEPTDIVGYISGSILDYKVNGIYQRRTIPNFTNIDKFCINASPTTSGSVGVKIVSRPINCSVNFSPSYGFTKNLTGVITSDAAFTVKKPRVLSLKSNEVLLDANYPTGIKIASGTTAISLNDGDSTYAEYTNNFYFALPALFGDVDGKFTALRTGAATSSILELSDSPVNSYYQASEFNGTWANKTFSYVDNILNYNLNFEYSSRNYLGNNLPAKVFVSFKPLTPTHNGIYTGRYITGLNMTSSGGYSVPPTFSGASYYYVTGLQNELSTFLFSTGCGDSVGVTFTGGTPSGNASGRLILQNVQISGIYGAGINSWAVVQSYSGQNEGSGYKATPTFVLATGGNCYSVPDKSGSEQAQFKKASGYGAVYAQAAGLTGLVVMSGTGVSGVQVSNIGLGYSAAYPPTFALVRSQGDVGHSGASGSFLLKNTGLYSFNTYWKTYADFGGGATGVPFITNQYSGVYDVAGNKNFIIQLVCSGLDNTAPVSGLLTVIVSGNGHTVTGSKIISQSRTFDLYSGKLVPPPVPSLSIKPLPDLRYAFDEDQFDSEYQSDMGYNSNIITF